MADSAVPDPAPSNGEVATVGDIDFDQSTVEFAGHSIEIDEGVGGVPGTATTIWSSAYVILRYLERTQGAKGLSSLRMLDLSAGTGLIGLACAAAGTKHVTMTEMGPDQMDRLRENLWCNSRNNPGMVPDTATAATAGNAEMSGRVRLMELPWGPGFAKALGCGVGPEESPFDLVVVSDVVYIALRDGLVDELVAAMKEVCIPGMTTLLLGFEARLCDEEEEFIASLGRHFKVREIPEEDLDKSDLRPEDDDAVAMMFYQPPEMHLYELTRA